MNKLYKVILLTTNEQNELQVRFCNDLKSRRDRLIRDKYTIIKEYENSELVDKQTLCELMLANCTFENDEQYDIVEQTEQKYKKANMKLVRGQLISGTTVQDVLEAVAI